MNEPTRHVSPTRESVTTIAEDGSRNFLRPADVTGRYTLLRRVSATLLILIFIALPYIQMGGYPAVFIDIGQRRFHLFGYTLATQDMWLFFFLVSGTGFTLFFLTAIFGRIFCGWACPQTVFLEHVYRRIERLIEGNASKQKQLDSLPWSDPQKLYRRGIKHILFVIVSALIVHIFIAYFVSIKGLYAMMVSSPLENWDVFFFMTIATGILYFNYSWFREQLCLIICPYGRLQSVLTDDDTLVVGYDELRGEPRGKVGKEGVGDCIGCNRCVQVCPTGIDIRQGYQMECVGCMNCIDACNVVMDTVKRPRGLISYSSANKRARQKTRILRPRVFVYLILMCIGLAVMTFSVSTYDSASLSLTRMPGQPFYIRNKNIDNQFNVRLINKSGQTEIYSIHVRAGEHPVQILGAEQTVTVTPMQEEVRAVILSLPRDKWTGPFDFTVHLRHEDTGAEVTRKATFIGPRSKN